MPIADRRSPEIRHQRSLYCSYCVSSIAIEPPWIDRQKARSQRSINRYMGRGSTFLANSSKALGISYQLVAAVAVVSAMGERFHSRPAAIGPSVLAADMSRLMEESVDVERHGADYIHLDVMDGHFVPNLTFGAPVIKGLRKHTKALLDAHLMVTNPAQWVDDMAEAGVDRLTFHVEATDKVSEVMAQVKAKGMGVGLALKPGTPVEDVFPYCEELDLVLVMTVEPGFGGQSFMADQMAKVRELRRRYPNLDIEVDGGLADDTIEEAARAGANLIVCGSYIFKGNRAERINFLKRAVEKYGNGKKDEDLTPCVAAGAADAAAAAAAASSRKKQKSDS